MQNVETPNPHSESEFAALVDDLAADPSRREQLLDLLREAHPIYDQRGTTTTVRMRGWVLIALARAGVSDAALLFVLEELDTGIDPYLVAAAARALRAYPNPTAAFAPFVMRALTRIRYRDQPLSFENYGEYAVASTGTSPVRELLATLAWLGPHARDVLPEIESLRAQPRALSKELLIAVDRAAEAIRGPDHADEPGADWCCSLPTGLRYTSSWVVDSRRGAEPIESAVFEDHAGEPVTFKEFFRGHPSIVVFFYSRCDNPLKCSLTVTKLARIQELLAMRGLAQRIHTAALTYDPAFDLPSRLRGYGQSRGVRMDAHHRMLRTTDSFGAIRDHFGLGVNFVESVVNRHRVEIYILDAEGRIAASFERIHWDEHQVVECAIEVLNEQGGGDTCNVARQRPNVPVNRHTVSSIAAPVAAFGVAFFPKCPNCWTAYLSALGITGLQGIPYSPWLQPVLVAAMLINLASVCLRGLSTGRRGGVYLVSAGALMIAVSAIAPGWETARVWGVALTLAGSLMNALSTLPSRSSASSGASVNWSRQPYRPRKRRSSEGHDAAAAR